MLRGAATSTRPLRRPPRQRLLRLRAAGIVGAVGGVGAATWVLTRDSQPTRLSAEDWVSLTVAGTEPLDTRGELRLLKLALPASARPARPKDHVSSPALAVQALFVKQPELMIQRPYTPLEPIRPDEGDGCVRLLVKRYADGEVSRYLHRLRVGDKIDVRGPVTTWACAQIPDRLTFLVGGTGLAPIVQLREALGCVSHVDVLIGVGRRDLLACVDELGSVAKRENTKVDVAVADGGEVPLPFNQAAIVGVPSATALAAWLGTPRGGLGQVIVCGPDPFVDLIAGSAPRPRRGLAGGVAGSLGYHAQTVTAL